MKFEISWLQKFVKINITPEKLADQLTDVGLEVEEQTADLLEIAVPPNRADCLGMVGIAREAAAVNNIKFVTPIVEAVPATVADKLTVQVLEGAACPKYLSRVIKGVDNTVPSPQWLQNYLTVAGIKCISAVVDITNFVLLEMGQPLHAYDLDKLNGGIVVRRAKIDETIMLLDDNELKLTPESLVIADHKAPIALAAIMGGKNSAINLNTKDIALESAYFDPVDVRLTARRCGIQSDSSYRFERCIDVEQRNAAIERATQLILEIVGGQPGPIVEFTAADYLPEQATVVLRLARVKRLLGIDVPTDKIVNILENLGMHVTRGASELTVLVPSFRTDITQEIDLIEEVVRILGFDAVPAQLPIGTLSFASQPEELISEDRILNCLINHGYCEAITYSFIDQEISKLFYPNVEHTVSLTNPISADMSLMRPTLLPGLVSAVLYNQNRQQNRVRLFEIGLRFALFDGNLEQVKTIAGVISGRYLPENWSNTSAEVDFYAMKNDITALFKLANNLDNLEFRASSDPAMHPGQCAEVYLGNARVGKVGALHPSLQLSLGLTTPVYMFELDYVAVVHGKVVKFKTFSKFPTVRRDLAFVVEQRVTSAKLEQAIYAKVENLLTEVVIFDMYQGKGIESGKKSIGLGITLQHPERTLNEVEVNNIFTDIILMFEKEFSATLR